MRIIFIDQYADLGGGQQCLLEIAAAVRERSWEARAVLPQTGPLSVRLERLGVPVRTVPCGPFTSGHKTFSDVLRFAWQCPASVLGVRGLIHEFAPGIIYVNGPRMLPAACVAAPAQTPILFHCHSLLAPRDAWLAAQSLRLSPRSRVIAGSRFVAAPLLRALPEGRVSVIHNGVPDCATPGRTTAVECRRIGLLGRIAPEKGHLEFVKAVRLLRPHLPHLRFLICGETLFPSPVQTDYAEKVREAARGLPIDFVPWRDDVRDVLAALDLLVVPSVGPESTTRVVLEAFSAGLPVVAFHTGGIPEVVEDQVTGFLVSPPTPEALSAALRDIVLHRFAEARSAAARARQAWEERFTAAHFQRRILEAIEQLHRSAPAVRATAGF